MTITRKINIKNNCLLILLILVLGLLLAGCDVSLAADITPPPESQPPTVHATVEQSIALPLVPPSTQNGKTIYIEKCVACHGENGMGDGVQANDLPNPVAAIGDPVLARNSTPLEWYEIITKGNLERFMPGFTSLNDRERWDVTAYIMTLSMQSESLQNGQQIFVENCLECHGADQENDLSQPDAVVDLSQSDLYTLIESGIGDIMPGFGDKLSDEEIWSVSAFTRTLGFAQSAITVSEDEPNTITATPTSEPVVFDTFSIKGDLMNVENVPVGQLVLLRGFDGMSQVIEQETSIDPNGQYVFSDLEYVEGRVYQASVIYEGIQYSSEVLHDITPDSEGFVDLPIQVRETTTDSSSLFAERMHIFFDVTAENTIQVVELFVINNPSDQVIVPVDSATPIIRYSLPEGALNLQFEQGELGGRYVETENGFGDLQPIDANQSFQFLFAYELPYKNNVDLQIEMPLDVDASIVMLPGSSFKVKSDQLQYTGERSMQGMQIQTYTTSSLEKGSTVDMELSGKLNTSVLTQNSTTGIVIGGVFLVAVVAFVVIWFLRKKKQDEESESGEAEFEEEETSLDNLLDAVIALDEAFDAGDISPEAYESRREVLIERIKKIRGENEHS